MTNYSAISVTAGRLAVAKLAGLFNMGKFQRGGGDTDVIGGDVIWPAQFAANGYIVDFDHPRYGPMKMVGPGLSPFR